MTLGNKIKEARKKHGMTQEELADKLMVSRQAITKWETDSGIPDIDNLRKLSKAFNVSLDYLVGDKSDQKIEKIREEIDFSKYGKPMIKANLASQFIKDRYQNEKVYMLYPEKELTKTEKVLDNTFGFFTDAGFGLPDIFNNAKMLGTMYYLLDTPKQKLLIVNYKEEYLETVILSEHVNTEKGNKFKYQDIVFSLVGLLK